MAVDPGDTLETIIALISDPIRSPRFFSATSVEYRDQIPSRGTAIVTVIGSHSLAHGEDPDERFYVTRSLAEVEANADAFKVKSLRVDLKPGEVFDMEIDCLQLTVRRPDEELDNEQVVLGDFDLMASRSASPASGCRRASGGSPR
jgi:hypothetical protein